jgi:hypothetical protein
VGTWPIRGSIVEPHKTYVTDVNFPTQGDPRAVLDPGEYEMRVTLQHGKAERAEACFRLDVPPLGSSLPLSIASIECWSP